MQNHSSNQPSADRPRRRTFSLRALLPLTYLALVGFSVGGLILWAGLRIQSDQITQIGSDLELQARLIADGVEDPLVRWEELYIDHLEHDYEDNEDDDEDELEAGHEGRYVPSGQSITLEPALIRLITAAAENTGGVVTLTDAELNVLYSSDGSETATVLALTPEFTTQVHDIRRTDHSLEQRLFVTEPVVKPGGTLSGYVQLSIPMSIVARKSIRTWSGLLLSGGLIFLLTVIISLALAHFILKPITTLTKGSAAIAAGDLSHHVPPSGPEELRRLGDGFNLMTSRLRDLLARQRDFVAHAAHELRTPLTALSLRLELVQSHGSSDPEFAARYLVQMSDEIEHLRRLSDQLLALTSLDSDENPTRRLLDLSPMLYRLADDFSTLVQQSGQSLYIEIPTHLPLIFANEDQIKAAVRNLLENALKYTDSGGSIILKADSEGDVLEICVSDTGQGIPGHAFPRLFDRFYRVDPARERQNGGAGLGLALVKEIVETHGGQVLVESEPGIGSRFLIHLPVFTPTR
ncbi:MAG: HAMP domain-containing protein [Anaerolineales bacterium]|nr:HAMP domain-containing protein [Anaerolineales bacterium]